MSRYVVQPCEEGRWHDEGAYNLLVDTETDQIIDNDNYVDCPEDATFRRGLAGLIDLLNAQDEKIKELSK